MNNNVVKKYEEMKIVQQGICVYMGQAKEKDTTTREK